MKEIRCQNPACNHCLSKDIEVGAGMYYITPSKPLRLYREAIKCGKCGTLNEVIVEMGVRVRINVIEENKKAGATMVIIKKNDLFSA